MVQLLINGLAMGAIYALVALGYVFVSNAVNVVNFSQGEFVMLSAFFALSASVYFHLPLILSYLVAIVLMAGFGVLFEKTVYAPLRKKNPITIIVSTIGVSLFLRNVALLIWGGQPMSFTSLFGNSMVNIGSLHIVPQYFLILGVTIVLVLFQEFFFSRTSLGRKMKATAQDQEAASLMGIRVSRMISFTFIYNAILTAVAGVMLAPIYFVSADMGQSVALKAFAAAIIGGFNNVRGAIVGGLMLGVIETFGAAYVSSAYKDAFSFIILILILIIRPQGLFGEKIAVKV